MMLTYLRTALTKTALTAIVFTAAVSSEANTAVTLPDTDSLLQQTMGLSVLGYEFVASNDITLTAIGILDSASNGLSSPHTITIWDDTGAAVLQLLVPAGGGELDSGFRYLDINPFVLSADIKYVIGVNYFGNNLDPVAVADSASQFVLDPTLTILGGRAGFDSLGIPLTETSEIYFGPNFRFSNVPLPGAVWLMLSGLGLLGVTRTRR